MGSYVLCIGVGGMVVIFGVTSIFVLCMFLHYFILEICVSYN